MAVGCGGGNSSIYSWPDQPDGGGAWWSLTLSRRSQLVPPVVSASDPVVGADYQLPDFLLNFHIFPWGPTKYTNKRSENKFDEIFSYVHPEWINGINITHVNWLYTL